MIVLNRIQIEGNLRYFNNSSILFKFYNYKYFYKNRSDDSDRNSSCFLSRNLVKKSLPDHQSRLLISTSLSSPYNDSFELVSNTK